MGIRRVFLDWSRPALPAAAEWLTARYAADGRLDLRSVVVALPGGRAGRRLLEAIVDVATARKLDLVPPRIITTGALPELLYRAKKPFADDLTQHLAWVAALRQMPAESLAGLVRNRPDDRDLFGWLPLGEMLAGLHRELAADALDCHEVIRAGARLPAFRDAARWKLLADIQARYLRQLDALELWDLQTARLYAIKHEECRAEGEIVLVGTADMNQSQRQMLDQVADRVTSLIFAPEALADRFDEHGCVIPAAWQDAAVALKSSQIEVVDRPGDQADAVLRALAAFDGRYTAEDVVVGVPDERLVPFVEQRLTECELPARYGVGTPVSQSEPYLLLEAIRGWLDGNRFESFADLMRHPAIEAWLLRSDVMGDLLTALDEFHDLRLPSGISAGAIAAAVKSVREEDVAKRTRFEKLAAAFDKIAELMTPLREGKKPLGDWGKAVVKLLVDVYGSRALNVEETRERKIVEACGAVHAALSIHQQVPESLAPKATGAEALRLLLAEVEAGTIPPPADEPSIELLGWLELPLDDAPALIVTGMNEKIVPSSQNADQFLPNELRRHLNLLDNDRRYARDVYALSVLAASRKELRLIAGRRFSDGEPLIPSRLLFTCDADETAKRANAWFGERGERPVRVTVPDGLRAGAGGKFRPPHPDKVREALKDARRGTSPATSMRVTEFKDYIACPYRYFLRHRLKLGRTSDAAREMEGSHFGKLLHEVLDRFGKDCVKDPAVAAMTSASFLETRLSEELDAASDRMFGAEPHPAVRVQVEMIRRRLMRFAQWQAGWAREGWRVRYVEHEIPGDKAGLTIPGGTMSLHGRIDRIDVREGSNETVVFDYKTGDSGFDPEKTHWNKSDESWTDLQLPLYRYACRWLDVGDEVKVGYIVLPKREEDVGDRIAGWDAAMFEDAVQEAERIAQAVREGKFWPPTAEPPGTFDELGAICGDYRFAGEVEEEGG